MKRSYVGTFNDKNFSKIRKNMFHVVVKLNVIINTFTAFVVGDINYAGR